MYVSIQWLKSYFEKEHSATEIAQKLSLSGTHAESVEVKGEILKNIRTAEIVSTEKHPNADRLTVCKVSFGSAEDVIVTAATNMKVGDKVGVAIPGAVLADGTEINPHDFRGIISNGMFVGFEEIGFRKDTIQKEDGEGIIILDPNTEIGIDLSQAMGLDQGVIEFEITPNRSDCLSMEGIALEYAATFDEEKKILPTNTLPTLSEREDLPTVSIDTEKVNAYHGGVVLDVTIAPSPLWLRIRLMESGLRPVNNIVDITNYIMLETGVPLHAFDLDQICQNQIHVKEEDSSQEITLIDGREVKTKEGDILICDGEGPVALAGVMGCARAEVTQNTKRVFIEGAHFDSKTIKQTGKRLSIESEAKNRFSKPLDPALAKRAVERALYLYGELGLKQRFLESFKTAEPREQKVLLRKDRIRQILGVEIEDTFILNTLSRLGIETKQEKEKFESLIPGFRPDITQEIDLIEEIGRVYGYHKIPSMPMNTELSVGHETKEKTLENELRHFMEGMGFSEVLTYSFVGPTLLERAGISRETHYIELNNPLGEEFSTMRPTMSAHFLEIAEKNIHRSNKNLRFFEVGQIFREREGAYEEPQVCTIFQCDGGDFYDFKSVVDQIFSWRHMPPVKTVRGASTLFHPGRSAQVLVDDKEIAIYGEIHPEIRENFDLPTCYMAILSMDGLATYGRSELKYEPISKFQPVTREFSFLVKEGVLFDEVKESLMSKDISIIEAINYFDEYRDASMEGKKSLTIQVIMQGKDHTLSDEELRSAADSIIGTMKEDFHGELR
ncbi:MAG: phenylalanine--tRNA ligase subunit beta [Tissierellia bacterium]|nr:phenylalanine--tRNA ligase subunit beta [Tissierellia bacterium]